MPSKRSARSSVRTVRIYLFTGALLVLFLALSFLVYRERHSAALVDATTHKPQPFTELYFNQPNQLPITARPGQRLPVAFTVHNVEGRNLTYTYSVDFTTITGKTTVLYRQQIAIANGQTTVISDAIVTVPSYTGRAEVSVVLINQPEAIHFWVERTS
jgi:hypothetical protein